MFKQQKINNTPLARGRELCNAWDGGLALVAYRTGWTVGLSTVLESVFEMKQVESYETLCDGRAGRPSEAAHFRKDRQVARRFFSDVYKCVHTSATVASCRRLR